LNLNSQRRCYPAVGQAAEGARPSDGGWEPPGPSGFQTAHRCTVARGARGHPPGGHHLPGIGFQPTAERWDAQGGQQSERDPVRRSNLAARSEQPFTRQAGRRAQPDAAAGRDDRSQRNPHPYRHPRTDRHADDDRDRDSHSAADGDQIRDICSNNDAYHDRNGATDRNAYAGVRGAAIINTCDTANGTTDYATNSTADHTANSTTDYAANSAADHTANSTTNHTANRATDYTADSTTNHAANSATDYAANDNASSTSDGNATGQAHFHLSWQPCSRT